MKNGRKPGCLGARGEKSPRSKLSNADRCLVRADRASGMTFRGLAAKWQVAESTVHYICAQSDEWTSATSADAAE